MLWTKKHKEDEKNKEIASLRGEANAYTKVGVVGGGGWAAAETAGWLAGDIALGGGLDKAAKVSSKTWKKIGFATAIVAMGAAGFALYKHSHANKLEEEKQKMLQNPSQGILP